MNNISTIINKINIRKREDGRYEGRITINGKRKSFYGGTKIEVKNKTKEYLQKIDNGYIEPKKIKLNDYIEYWLKTYKWNKIEPSSYSRLYSVYEHQIKDGLGKKMIGDITSKDIQSLLDERANPTNKNTKPLAMSGLKKIIHLLRPCLSKAESEGIIQKNPCIDVILPSKSCVQVLPKKQITLSDTEIEDFKNVALEKYKTTNEYKSRDAFVLLLILNLGLRVGEAIALRWSDFDLENKIVHINKTLQSNITEFANGTIVDESKKTYSRIKQATKTDAGTRVLKLNDSALYYISELKEYDLRNKIKSPYLCSTNKGTLNNPRNLQRSLDRIIKRTNITENVSLHTLRHTFGSTLIRRGIGVEVVSKLMGHANIHITYLKYIHVIQEQEAMAMDMVNVC